MPTHVRPRFAVNVISQSTKSSLRYCKIPYLRLKRNNQTVISYCLVSL